MRKFFLEIFDLHSFLFSRITIPNRDGVVFECRKVYGYAVGCSDFVLGGALNRLKECYIIIYIMGIIDLRRVLKNRRSGWISISKDYKRVIAKDQTLGGLVKKLQRLGNPEGYLVKAANDYSRYVG